MSAKVLDIFPESFLCVMICLSQVVLCYRQKALTTCTPLNLCSIS